jgi:hypothetical protein
MYLLFGETRVSDPCPHHRDQRGRNPGSERAGATAAALTISESTAQRKPHFRMVTSHRPGLAYGHLPVPSEALIAAMIAPPPLSRGVHRRRREARLA